jgi:glycosyltransferase involved in cell wall biosynthesis
VTPVRVVVLDHTAQTGGAELALLRTVAALDPALVDVTVLLFADGPLVDRLRSVGARVRVLTLDPRVAGTDRHSLGRLSALRTVPFVARLARELRALAPDVVHTTSLKADLIGLLAGRLARRPVVWHVHDRIATDYLPGPVVRVIRLLARRAAAEVVVNSRATADTLLPLPRWTLAHPGLAPEQIGPDPIDRVRPPEPVVGIVGRISPTKGQLEFLAAAELLADRFPALRFRVIGDALFAEQEYADRVRSAAARPALSGRVEFTGWVADPAAELDRLTVMVHASPTPEPFGQVVAEAMARGVPVVATAGGGVDEIVRPVGEEPRGELVAAGDVAGLTEAISWALTDPDTAASRARQAWFGVRRDYPVERTAAILTAVWQRHARGSAPAASGAPGPTRSAPRPVSPGPAER